MRSFTREAAEGSTSKNVPSPSLTSCHPCHPSYLPPPKLPEPPSKPVPLPTPLLPFVSPFVSPTPSSLPTLCSFSSLVSALLHLSPLPPTPPPPRARRQYLLRLTDTLFELLAFGVPIFPMSRECVQLAGATFLEAFRQLSVCLLVCLFVCQTCQSLCLCGTRDTHN